MRPFLKYYWIALPVLLMLTSCSSSSRENNNQSKNIELTDEHRSDAQSYYEEIFLPGEDRIFRNIDLDLPIAEVKKIESDFDLDLTNESEEHLQYEKDLKVDTVNGIDYVEVKYIFDQHDRLDIVTVNYYIQDSLTITNLFDHLNTSFIDKYGDYYLDSDGYTVWESAYTREEDQEITYDIGIRKFTKLNDPGITIEMMRFGAL